MANTIGLFLGPLVALIIYLVPMPALSPKAHVLAAILSWIVVWWICEPVPIPISALLGAVFCVVFGVAEAKVGFAPFADPIIYLFLGSFILAEAMALLGLDKRFAYAIMSLKFVGNSTGRILLAYGFMCAFLSMWISNTAATAMMFPIGLGIIYAMGGIVAEQTGKDIDPTKLRFGTGMMLMAAYAASTGGIGTPVGTPPNLIGIAMIENYCKRGWNHRKNSLTMTQSVHKMVDIIIQGGLIVDGTGSEPYEGDIGITGERIVFVKKTYPFSRVQREFRAKKSIDAKGMVVCPGFIDTHAHSDFILLADPRAEGKVLQGITTELNGNCGLSAAPLYDEG